MKWLQYSGIWITLVINPLHWRFSFDDKADTLLSAPHMKQVKMQFAFISLRVVVDDGTW